GRKIVSITVVLAAIAVGLFVFRQLRPRPQSSVNELERTSLPHLAVAEKGIAVLPFENLSDDKANAYFADGIQDEVAVDRGPRSRLSLALHEISAESRAHWNLQS